MAGVVFVLGLLVVGGLLFLGASLLLGRGETQPPADYRRSPVELPDDRDVVGDDVRALRISVAFRGYRMSEVDWLLDQFAQVLDERDAEIATLRAGSGPGAHGAHAVGAQGAHWTAPVEVEPVEVEPAEVEPAVVEPVGERADVSDTDPEGVPVAAVDEERRAGA